MEDILNDLQKRLHLTQYPFRIECFDISNIMGTSAVGSMVVFEDGIPLKQGYRRFRIQSVHQPDDYAMMQEVLTRRLHGAAKDGIYPDLIVVDGGKGQLGVLVKALHETGSSSIDGVALAKAHTGEQGKKGEEKVFIPGRKNHVPFPKKSKSQFLLQRIRDEAHRFAVSYHSTLKKKKDFTSELETIPGIGQKTVKVLLKHFGSLENVKEASIEQLSCAPTITKKRAETIFGFFHPFP
ncbi:MAG: excinuclease ABC subunit C, partial [Deltaproteobacteria bacterium]|nr:excinuclease ABC subunit C [Deltaproteobacteria bacterium]